MKLTEDELRRFDEDGYLFFPGRFTPEEVGVLKQAAAEVYALQREEVWRESSGVARTAFAAHTYNEAFRRLGAHPRLIEPVMQLVDGPVYMHQYKVNAKVAFDGEVWQWHQDYGTWRRDDDMPEPRAMNIAVFIDEVTAANGPLLFIPGSHKSGVLEAGHDLETTSYPLWTLDRDTVKKLAERGGCVAPTGPAGGMLLFSSLLVHASPPNISPMDRTIVYLSLCHVDNHIRRFKRKEWIAHRDFTPIEPLADDCLMDLADDQAALGRRYRPPPLPVATPLRSPWCLG
jgi:ectoine hydroxylase